MTPIIIYVAIGLVSMFIHGYVLRDELDTEDFDAKTESFLVLCIFGLFWPLAAGYWIYLGFKSFMFEGK